MSDDAEFDAFLKGEDALSRRLQALPAAAPGAALDAAILQRARELMAQESRPEAANDAGDGSANPMAPRLGRLGWRWRIPAGIAATVLVGVFANQAYQASSDMQRGAGMPAEESKVLIVLPESHMRESAQMAPPVEVAIPAAESPPSRPVPAAAPAPETKAVTSAPPDAAPPSGPVVEDRRRKAAVPPPAADTYANQGLVQEYVKPAPVTSNSPAPAPVVDYAAPADKADYAARRSARADADAFQRIEVSGSSIKRPAAPAAPAPAPVTMAPGEWLAMIESLLAAGKEAEALGQWRQFRQANPGYPVPQTTEERIKALAK